jgi:hypothetical protein
VNDFFNPLTKIGRLRQAILNLLREHEVRGELPTNGHFLYYELEQRGTVDKRRAVNPKTGEKYVRPPIQDTVDALLDFREAGHVPWNWIIDETRDVTEPAFAETVADYLRERIDVARIDLWNGEPPPLIITESRATTGALRATAFDYLTPITATGGQAGGYLVTEVAPLLRGNERRVLWDSKPTPVIGHRDPLHEREQCGWRVHRCAQPVAVHKKQQTIGVAAVLRQNGVVPIRQAARRLGIHCVDAA